MKLWNLNGMKSKQIKLFIIVIFTACIIWGWDKASRPSVIVLHPDPLSLFRPGWYLIRLGQIDTCILFKSLSEGSPRRGKVMNNI
jgi:hypothetical protein